MKWNAVVQGPPKQSQQCKPRSDKAADRFAREHDIESSSMQAMSSRSGSEFQASAMDGHGDGDYFLVEHCFGKTPTLTQQQDKESSCNATPVRVSLFSCHQSN